MKNYILKLKNYYFFIFIFLFSFLLFDFSQAAVLYLEPSNNEYHQGDTFISEIRINTKECINTVEVNLSFPQDILKVIDFSQGNSILNIWVKHPKIIQESGLISFSGGIPGGYCGRISGDPGESNLIGRIIFKANENEIGLETEAKIYFLENSQVLLNDGLGTSAELFTREAIYSILIKSLKPLDEWEKELERDNIFPESFKIEIHQEPVIFDGKYFITFSTTDKQTGIDYYEIKEGKKDWKITNSPYLLEDQTLQSKILVKAVDKAGNKQIAEYRPSEKSFIYLLIILILIGIIVWVIYKFVQKK